MPLRRLCDCVRRGQGVSSAPLEALREEGEQTHLACRVVAPGRDGVERAPAGAGTIEPAVEEAVARARSAAVADARGGRGTVARGGAAGERVGRGRGGGGGGAVGVVEGDAEHPCLLRGARDEGCVHGRRGGAWPRRAQRTKPGAGCGAGRPRGRPGGEAGRGNRRTGRDRRAAGRVKAARGGCTLRGCACWSGEHSSRRWDESWRRGVVRRATWSGARQFRLERASAASPEPGAHFSLEPASSA